MNERIKELADEAAKFSAIMALPTGESGDKLFVEKFAELIIQDCLLSLEPNSMAPEIDYDVELKFYQRSARKIKQHFGVDK